jgi:predicted DNA-binding transcriptional regulator YafY
MAADQAVVEENDSNITLSATVADTAQLRWWLLSFGSSVEVIEPASLREEMARNAYWMHRSYAQTGVADGNGETPDAS